MGRKARVKRQERFRKYMRREMPQDGRENRKYYRRVMAWAKASGYSKLMGVTPLRTYADSLAGFFQRSPGAIAYGGDAHLNTSRKVLAGRLNFVAYRSKPGALDHKYSRHLPLRMVDCFPHLSRKMLKTMPRGQAFARIVKLENNAND